MDDATRFKWSYFVKSKAEFGVIMQRYIYKLVSKYNINYLRCGNAGENQVLKEICEKNSIDMEWTSPNTPQENGVVERGFAMIR